MYINYSLSVRVVLGEYQPKVLTVWTEHIKVHTKKRGLIFFQYGPEQAWLIRDLLNDCHYPKIFKRDLAGSFGTVPVQYL